MARNMETCTDASGSPSNDWCDGATVHSVHFRTTLDETTPKFHPMLNSDDIPSMVLESEELLQEPAHACPRSQDEVPLACEQCASNEARQTGHLPPLPPILRAAQAPSTTRVTSATGCSMPSPRQSCRESNCRENRSTYVEARRAMGDRASYADARQVVGEMGGARRAMVADALDMQLLFDIETADKVGLVRAPLNMRNSTRKTTTAFVGKGADGAFERATRKKSADIRKTSASQKSSPPWLQKSVSRSQLPADRMSRAEFQRVCKARLFGAFCWVVFELSHYLAVAPLMIVVLVEYDQFTTYDDWHKLLWRPLYSFGVARSVTLPVEFILECTFDSFSLSPFDSLVLVARGAYGWPAAVVLSILLNSLWGSVFHVDSHAWDALEGIDSFWPVSFWLLVVGVTRPLLEASVQSYINSLTLQHYEQRANEAHQSQKLLRKIVSRARQAERQAWQAEASAYAAVLHSVERKRAAAEEQKETEESVDDMGKKKEEGTRNDSEDKATRKPVDNTTKSTESGRAKQPNWLSASEEAVKAEAGGSSDEVACSAETLDGKRAIETELSDKEEGTRVEEARNDHSSSSGGFRGSRRRGRLVQFLGQLKGLAGPLQFGDDLEAAATLEQARRRAQHVFSVLLLQAELRGSTYAADGPPTAISRQRLLDWAHGRLGGEAAMAGKSKAGGRGKQGMGKCGGVGESGTRGDGRVGGGDGGGGGRGRELRGASHRLAEGASVGDGYPKHGMFGEDESESAKTEAARRLKEQVGAEALFKKSTTIDREAFVMGVERVYKEQRLLTASVDSFDRINQILHRVCLVAWASVLLFVYIIVMGVDFVVWVVPIVSLFVSLVLLVGRAPGDVLSGASYTLFFRPFDIGDRVAISQPGEPSHLYSLIVVKIELVRTHFHSSQGEMLYIENHVLRDMSVTNLSRTASFTVYVQLQIPMLTSPSKMTEFVDAIKQYVKEFDSDWTQVDCMFTQADCAQNSMMLDVWLGSRHQAAEVNLVYGARSHFFQFLHAYMHSAGIEFMQPAVQVRLDGAAGQAASALGGSSLTS